MNTKPANSNTTRIFLVAAAAVVMLVFFAITPTFGQKEQAERATTREGLTETGFMTNPDVSDDLDGTGDEYFYKFQACAGKLTVTFEVAANETNAGATLDLFGVNSRVILSNVLAQGVDGGSERVSKSVNIAKAQEIIIRIKGLKYGSSSGYPGVYKIRLEGAAVSFTEVAPSSVVDQAVTPDVAPPVSSGQNNKPEAAPTDATDQAKEKNDLPSDVAAPDEKPASAPSDKSSKSKKTDKVEKAVDKATTKSQKLLDLIEKVKPKKP